LGGAGIVSTDLAERLGRMARFRNRLVHLYWKIDNERLWEVLRESLDELEAYLGAIGALIEGTHVNQRHQLGDVEKHAVKNRLRERLAARSEVRFAYLHGSFLDADRFGDIDIAVSVERGSLSGADPTTYELNLEAVLERGLDLPVDVRVVEMPRRASGMRSHSARSCSCATERPGQRSANGPGTSIWTSRRCARRHCAIWCRTSDETDARPQDILTLTSEHHRRIITSCAPRSPSMTMWPPGWNE
jgi:hypothetical protein